MRHKTLLILAALAVGILGLSGTVRAASETITLKDMGSFHIGGERVTLSGLPVKEVQTVPGGPVRKSDPNGDYMAGQMYVQYMIQANPIAEFPLLMWHGGGLTGVTWETKPDGKPGWHTYFLRAGFSTYVSDAVERGRASWARTEIVHSEAEHRTMNAGWGMFRFGPAEGYNTDPAKRIAYEGQLFPVASLEQFWRQSVARWTTSTPATKKAYLELMDKLGPSILVAHSQGGSFALNVSQDAPDKFKAIVLVEPSGAPNPEKVDVSKVKGIKYLVIWGDYFDKSALWQSYRGNVEKYLDAVRKAGATVDVLDLPTMGIKGNSHMLMMDTNSDEVAALALAWLKKQGLAK